VHKDKDLSFIARPQRFLEAKNSNFHNKAAEATKGYFLSRILAAFEALLCNFVFSFGSSRETPCAWLRLCRSVILL
jgi:hypothetical protein